MEVVRVEPGQEKMRKEEVKCGPFHCEKSRLRGSWILRLWDTEFLRFLGW
jgi:hypothetical protein